MNIWRSTCFLTVSERIVESNPKKFNLDAAELSKRKAFITSTRLTVKVRRYCLTCLLRWTVKVDVHTWPHLTSLFSHVLVVPPFNDLYIDMWRYSSDWLLTGFFFWKEMKEQMSSPAVASMERKNKQVTAHSAGNLPAHRCVIYSLHCEGGCSLISSLIKINSNSLENKTLQRPYLALQMICYLEPSEKSSLEPLWKRQKKILGRWLDERSDYHLAPKPPLPF